MDINSQRHESDGVVAEEQSIRIATKKHLNVRSSGHNKLSVKASADINRKAHSSPSKSYRRNSVIDENRQVKYKWM